MALWFPSIGGERKILLLILLLANPQHCFSGCVFGANNTQALALRNRLIALEMFVVVIKFYHNATLETSVFNFNLSTHMEERHNVTVLNLLNFTQYGKLLQIDWVAETQGTVHSELLSNLILNWFINPVHSALQKLAVKYRFSYGIFRPKMKDLYFTGLTYLKVDINCLAGVVIINDMELSMPYLDAFTSTNSTEFATLATMLETAFDSHFRGISSPYTNDFARVNVLSVSASNGSTIYGITVNPKVEVEFYFINESRSKVEIESYLGLLPNMSYDDGKTQVALVILMKTVGNGLWSSSSPTPATTPFVTEDTTVLATTTDSSTLFESTISSEFSTTQQPTISIPDDFTNTSLLNNTSFTISTISSISSDMITDVLTTVSILSNIDQPTSLSQNIGASTADSGTSSAANIVPNASGLEFGSFQSTSATHALPINSTESMNNKGTTTFDPDPLFMAAVPVIPKVYNDRVLIGEKVGTMAPLLQKSLFYWITVPAAIGMIAIIVVCLVCLQRVFD